MWTNLQNIKKQSIRGKWATILLNDLSGSSEINIYSDVFVKHEDVLVEKQLILVDAEIKNDTNQGCKIVARRLTLLNDFISEKKFNLTLVMDNFNNMKEIYSFSKTLFAGNSSLIINIQLNGQAIKFIVKENIKISSELISNITKINNVRSISFA
jgi:DNA polymerase III alpha subunit